MSVRKRSWTTAKGETKEAWIADYCDQAGRRHVKTFARKKEAQAFEDNARVEVRAGTHTADSASVTVAKAADLWLATCEGNRLERATIDAYRQHVELHILPFLGREKLSQLSPPVIRAYENKLKAGSPAPGETEGKVRSPAMVKKILGSLGALLADAQEQGLVARNVVRELRSNRKRGKEKQAEKRQKGKLKVGVDIPEPAEIRAIVGVLREGRWRPFLLVAIFCGLRASELRGLRWSDVDLERRELHVRQRADRYKEIGKPKSHSGERTVPFPKIVASALKEWKLACPKGEENLVFPSGAGEVEYHTNVVRRGFWPMQVAAGVVAPVLDANGKPKTDKDGKPIVAPKYKGLHSLRHFYASWCINRPEDGGLGLPAKLVQERLGHSTIQMTLDVYGHLFARGDDSHLMDAAERALLG